MPGRKKLYVVNSPALVQTVQRYPYQLSFWFIEAKFTSILGGLSAKTSELLRANVHGELGKSSLFLDGMKAGHKAIMPGKEQERMSSVALGEITKALDRLESDLALRRFDLWKWVEHEMLLWTTDSFYGPKNPYRNPQVERGFW